MVLLKYYPITVQFLFCLSFLELKKNVFIIVYVNVLSTCNILSPNQYGFREEHSTSLALVNFVNIVTSALDNEQILIGLFLDLSKAFDTLDHRILLYKLNMYGIRGVT